MITRHPFPPHWHVPSFDNYTSVELTSGTEFEQVRREFHASLPRGTMELLSVTRYVSVRPACVPRCLTVLSCSCTMWVIHGAVSRTGISGSVTSSNVIGCLR